jgi:large subunit ribosomal protein L30
MKKIAIIRIRGQVRVKKEILDTMDMLKLYNQHTCVIYDNKPAIIGMIKKIKDYVTWGEVDDESIKLLIEKRGKPDPKDKTKTKAYFRLSPPKKGFERKGIKKTFKEGGALGYRGEKIKELISKMI